MAVAAPERLIYKYSVSNGEFSTVGTETSSSTRSAQHRFPAERLKRALIVAYEPAMNIVIHASQGAVSTFWKDGALEIVVTDTGPGIEDIEKAMTEGYSTAPGHVKEMGFGAGMGLPNAKACSDSMEITSELDVGTTVVCHILPGKQETSALPYFHSVKLETERCLGCTNCIKGCPTEAIRVRGGKAFILQDRCIDCGECIRRCPNNAKVAVADDWDILDTFDYKIALVAPSFTANLQIFPRCGEGCLVCRRGFDEVFDVSIAADLVTAAMREYINPTRQYVPIPVPARQCSGSSSEIPILAEASHPL